MLKRGWIVIAGGLALCVLPALGQKNSCLECHANLEGELKAPVEAFKLDIHGQFGLSCANCHGGNPAEDDMDRAKDKTFKGAPARAAIPEFCGKCHADAAYIRTFNPNLRVDQLSLYWTSRHGILLKKGDSKPAVCIDCHGVHGIQTAKYPKSPTFPWNIPQTCGRCHADPKYMSDYRILTNQLAEYKESVHANALFEKKDLAAPACNGCHGNHGAYPPTVKSIAQVCRQCHPSAGDLFSRSPHKKAFDDLGISECEACHGNHKILPPATALLGTAQGSVCVQCHDSGSPGYRAAEELKSLIDNFQARMRDDDAILGEAARKGVEVSQPRFRLQDVNTTLISAQNLVHGLDLGEIRAKLKEGDQSLAEIREEGVAALAEARFRRRGLVIATIFLALLAIALYVKIRGMRRTEP
jgi:predicted CXXCH cytochrome family protein